MHVPSPRTRQLEIAIMEHARQLAFGVSNKQHWIKALKLFASKHLASQLRDCVGKPNAVLCIDDEHFGQLGTIVRIERFGFVVRTDADEFRLPAKDLRSAAEEETWMQLAGVEEDGEQEV